MDRKKIKGAQYFSTVLTLVIILVFVIYAIVTGESFLIKVHYIEDLLFAHLHFLFFAIINITLIVLVILAFTKYGKKKIGGDDAKVDYSWISWCAMLFSAGMGIGIMFYGVAEPLSHYYYNPLFVSQSSSASALATTYFSWGIHAWGIYVLIGLAFAHFTYTKKLPLSLRSLFYPILKDKIYTRIGDVIDSIGAVITLFALASSLALGSMQINSGAHFLLGINISIKMQVLIIILIIIIATISVISGLDKGVKILSELNLKLAALLGLFILILGPTIFILKNFIFSSFIYVIDLIPASLAVNHVDPSWANTWPIFYMAWWISWSIFVGMFIAKISKGRTIRQFILAILLIPTILSIIWFSILGSSAIFVDNAGVLSSVVDQDISLSLFMMLELLVSNNIFRIILQLLAFIIIVFFFITSSDSGSLVVNSLVNKQSSSVYSKIFWSLTQGLLAIIIIVIGGVEGISLIQSLLIIISLPLTFFLLYVLIILVRDIVITYK